jgi:hypothetical protein
MAYSPQVPDDAKIILGEGKVYKDYGELTEAVLGAPRGGATFSVDKEIKEIEFDGAYGPVEGLRRKTKCVPSLKVSLLELDDDLLVDIVPGASTTPVGTYDEVSESLDIAATDYYTNITFVGETLDGDSVVIIIDNALADDKLEMAFKSKDELVIDVTFTGHYDTSTPTTVPYKVRFYA